MSLGLQFRRLVSSRYQVERCSFSPDGKLLAACFSDYSIRVFRVGNPAENTDEGHAYSPTPVQLDSVFRQHRSNVWCVDFATDCSLMCTCSSDMTVKVWDLDSRTEKLTFKQHSDTVWCCSFSAAGIIASGSSDKTVKIWSYESGEVIHDLNSYFDAIDCLDFSKDGAHLCTGSRDGTVRLWSNITSKVVPPTCLLLHASDAWIRFCTFSNSIDEAGQCQDFLAACGSNNVILVWNMQTLSNSEEEKSFSSSAENPLKFVQADCASTATTDSSAGIAPKFTLCGHLNTVWSCSIATLSNSTDSASDDERKQHKNVLISCSGDRTMR